MNEPAATESTDRLDFGALIPGIGVFGGVRRFLEIGNELVKRGHRFVLYHPNGDRPEWLPYHAEVAPLQQAEKSRHQILLCNDPTMLDYFERLPADLKLFYNVLEKIKHERRILTSPDWTILANSTGIQQRIWKKYRVRAEPVIGGLNTQVFHPQERPAESRDMFRILVYGRVSRRTKGVPLCIHAAEAFARKVAPSTKVQLVLFDHVGPGNERDPRDQVQTSLPLEFHINCSQEELAKLYSSCDVFLSAERKAGWSNTVMEAMACGIPVVCTRSGTIDLARHLETAYVVRWRHPWFLERGVRKLHGDQQLAERLRQAALRRAESFSWEHVVDQLEDVVRRRLAISSAPNS